MQALLLRLHGRQQPHGTCITVANFNRGAQAYLLASKHHGTGRAGRRADGWRLGTGNEAREEGAWQKAGGGRLCGGAAGRRRSGKYKRHGETARTRIIDGEWRETRHTSVCSWRRIHLVSRATPWLFLAQRVAASRNSAKRISAHLWRLFKNTAITYTA